MKRLICLLVLTLVASGCASGLRIPNLMTRTVCFGDSMVDGDSNKNFWEYVREDKSESRFSYANEGKGGDTIAEGLKRFKSLVKYSIYPNATVLIYWQGGKDVMNLVKKYDPLLLVSPTSDKYRYKSELERDFGLIESNLELVILRAKQQGWKVYMATYYNLRPGFQKCSAFPINVLFPLQIRNINEYIAMLNQRIRKVTIKMGVTLVDIAVVSDEITMSKTNYHDCLHLSKQGNRIAADVFLEAMRE